MTRSRLTRYGIFLLIVLIAGVAVHQARSVYKQNLREVACELNDPDCEEFIHWDLGMVSLEKIEIQPNDMLGNLLSNRGVDYLKIDALIHAAKSIFPLRSIRAGKELTIISDNADSTVHAFIYEPDPYRQILYHLEDSIRVEVVEKETTIKIESAGGVIEQSLWLSMDQQNLPTDLMMAMEDALGWSVDFYHIQKGDEYKVIYERKYVEGVPVGVGKLIGAEYTSGDTKFHAIRFDSGKHDGYFDLEGRSMKKAFLKSPVQYSRISSRYSTSRFHPVLQRYKGHFGTDYAAPCGTPIRAVADGRVTIASYTKNNGYYVKIKHDKTYETQYLHMSKFGTGIKAGTMVKQGQTIGYIGKTGLATGCHVCYRFWKNGKQVDHLREKMPPPEAMEQLKLPEFFELSSKIKAMLEAIDVHAEPVQAEEDCNLYHS